MRDGPPSLKDVNRFRMFPELLVVHSDHALALASVHGHIGQGLEGFYRHQTRFLSRLKFLVNGQAPAFVSANPVDPYSFTSYYVAPSPARGAAGPRPTDARSDGGEIVEKAIEIQVNRFVGGGMHQDVIVTNHGLVEATIELTWDIEADFADISEAIRGYRQQEAPIERRFERTDGGAELTLQYKHPALAHATRVRFNAGPWEALEQDGQLVHRACLKPRVPTKLCLDVIPVFCGQPSEPTYDCDSFRSHDTAWDQVRDAWALEATRLCTPNAVVQRAWDRSVSDLASLALFHGEGPERSTPAAGIPLYQALFGRDTLTTTWQAGLVSRGALRGTILSLAKWQGVKRDDRYDEEPGKHLHQHQLSPLSLLGLNPYLHYYGDYAGPGLFLVAIAWDFLLSGDRDFARQMREPILRTLDWMERDGDRDGDGFYEYETRAGAWGTKNQGWKDSPEAVLYPDGLWVENPIASVEIQGYYFAAKQLMGFLFLALGDVARGTDLLAEAQQLKRRFNAAFWLPEAQFYAQALDANKAAVGSIASNVGHCLACGIVDADKAPAVAGRLMAPDMFSGWGIRTLSSEHPAYNPFAYHLGSVWPSENGSIALGFKRYGLNTHVHDLARGLFDATTIFNLDRLPEAIGGHPRDRRHPHPGIYPNSNAPQAWSSSAIIMLIQSMTGVLPIAPIHTLLLDPDLPDWLPELTLENVRVGEATVSLRFRRDASGYTHHQVLSRQGRVHVLRQAPPESVTAGLGDRLGDALSTLLHR